MPPVKLVPIRPPGPNARKARAYETDILQLRAQGYTFEAIREALAAAGIHVSNSTVQREAARASKQPAAAAATAANSLTDGVTKSPPPPLTPAAPATVAVASVNPAVPQGWHNGKDVAEAYTSNLITNPFVRAKERR